MVGYPEYIWSKARSIEPLVAESFLASVRWMTVKTTILMSYFRLWQTAVWSFVLDSFTERAALLVICVRLQLLRGLNRLYWILCKIVSWLLELPTLPRVYVDITLDAALDGLHELNRGAFTGMKSTWLKFCMIDSYCDRTMNTYVLVLLEYSVFFLCCYLLS